MKLMFGALIRAAERWKSIRVTEFERRQLSAVKKELDQEYEAPVDRDGSAEHAQINVRAVSIVRSNSDRYAPRRSHKQALSAAVWR